MQHSLVLVICINSIRVLEWTRKLNFVQISILNFFFHTMEMRIWRQRENVKFFCDYQK